MKQIRKFEESLERIQPAQPDAVFLKKLETTLTAHKTTVKHVSIAATLAVAASLTLLFAANLYVLSISDREQSTQFSERMIDEYNLYAATFKTFGDE